MADCSSIEAFDSFWEGKKGFIGSLEFTNTSDFEALLVLTGGFIHDVVIRLRAIASEPAARGLSPLEALDAEVMSAEEDEMALTRLLLDSTPTSGGVAVDR